MNPLAIETASSRFNPRQGIDVGVDGCESICRLEIRQIELLPAPWQANSSCSRQISIGEWIGNKGHLAAHESGEIRPRDKRNLAEGG